MRGWVVAFFLFMVWLGFFPSSSVSSPFGFHSRAVGKRAVTGPGTKRNKAGEFLSPGLSRGNYLHREENGTEKNPQIGPGTQ